MAQTSISIRMDEELKKQFEKFCSDVGMSMTTAFCVFAKAAVRKQRIPFDIEAEPEGWAATAAAMEEVRRMKKDPSIGKTYTDVDDMMKELLDDAI